MLQVQSEPSPYKPIFAVCDSSESIRQILRERFEALNVTRLTIDDATGLTTGYTGKLLSPASVKNPGMVSLIPLLVAAGLKLIIFDDAEAIARSTKLFSRFPKREQHQARAGNKSATRGAEKKRQSASRPKSRSVKKRAA